MDRVNSDEFIHTRETVQISIVWETVLNIEKYSRKIRPIGPRFIFQISKLPKFAKLLIIENLSQINSSHFSQLFTKVLMASAATNALRLHQRIPQLSISAQTLQNILAEDSGHYLAYSLMFMSGRQQ